jgi:uncharacterized protein
MKKIDIHTHVTNRKLENSANSDASVAALQRKMQQFDVEKAVVLASYFPHRGSGISNFRLLNWTRDNPNLLMFGSLDFNNYPHQGMNELSELSELRKLRGIKIYTGYQEVDLRSQQLGAVLDLAREHSLPMMFHTGYSHTALRKYNRPAITEMVSANDLEFLLRENPELNFIFSHLSKPNFTDMATVANRHNNVYTDVSGLVDSRNDRGEIPETVNAVRRFLDHAGPEKIMFGTDFPVQTHEDSIYFVEKAMERFSDSDRMKVYYQNAEGLLKNE